MRRLVLHRLTVLYHHRHHYHHSQWSLVPFFRQPPLNLHSRTCLVLPATGGLQQTGWPLVDARQAETRFATSHWRYASWQHISASELRFDVLQSRHSTVVAIGLSAYHSRPPGASVHQPSGIEEAITRTRCCLSHSPHVTTMYRVFLYTRILARVPIMYVQDASVCHIPSCTAVMIENVLTPGRCPGTWSALEVALSSHARGID